jgi:hypothetical protein
MLVITYDEHGGYFDHVPPPQTTDDTLARFGKDGFQQLGFRVPAIVAGPYVKQGHISSVTYNHASALRHLQNEFGLEPLTARVDAANDLMDCIDLDRLARRDAAPPIELPVLDSLDWPTDDASCGSTGGFPRTAGDDSILDWADAHPEKLAGYDLRAEQDVYLRSIRNFLRTHGVRRG